MYKCTNALTKDISDISVNLCFTIGSIIFWDLNVTNGYN